MTSQNPRSARITSVILGVLSLAPAALLAHANHVRAWASAAAVLALAALLRGGLRRLAPERARGYLVARGCSPRYLLPALGLPLLGAALIARLGAWGLSAVLLAQIALAHHHRAAWKAQRALANAWLPALLGGVHCALEWLALRGPELAFGGRLLYAEQTPRQRLVLLERGEVLALLIDGGLQFSSDDERLYHSGLLEPALALLRPDARVLVLGGGDGLAARDLLRSGRVAHVTIVDWEPALTRLFRDEPRLRALNADALRDPRVQLVHRDVREPQRAFAGAFDLIVGDLTDPEPNGDGAVVCSSAFYLELRTWLRPGGAIITHTSSADGLAEAAVPAALESAGFQTHRYALDVPSFQRISYVLGSLRPFTPEQLPAWALDSAAPNIGAHASSGSAS